ncbi:MAG: HIT domain-containing protein [Spirochaetota bacterium]
MPASFLLHPQLEADTSPFRELELSAVRIMNNGLLPWLILVPRVADARDIIDLTEEQQQQLTREIAAASRALRTAFRPDKLNVAALGNMVPQLHVHIIARFSNDPAWPKPVWGNLPPAPYSEGQLGEFCDCLRAHWQ